MFKKLQLTYLTILIIWCSSFLTKCVEYTPPDTTCSVDQHCFRGQICDQQVGICISIDQINHNDTYITIDSAHTDIIETLPDTNSSSEEFFEEQEEEIQDTEIFYDTDTEPEDTEVFEEPEEEIQDTEIFEEPEEEIQDTEIFEEPEEEIQDTEIFYDTDTEPEDTDIEEEIEDTEILEETREEIEDTDIEEEPQEEIEDSSELITPEEDVLPRDNYGPEKDIQVSGELFISNMETLGDISECSGPEYTDTEAPECEYHDDCINDLFCDGEEYCNENGECLSGLTPCPEELCDEEREICIQPAFVTAGSLSLESSIVDSFNSISGDNNPDSALTATNSTADSAIQITTSTIRGNLFAGPGSDTDYVVSIDNGSQITGNITSLQTPVQLYLVSEPDGMPPNENHFRESNRTITFDSDRHFRLFEVSDSTIIIRGNIRILCANSFKLENSILDIQDDAHLELYLKQSGEFISVTTNTTTDNPEQLKIFGFGFPLTISSSEIYAIIQNPEGALTITDSTFYGAFQAETAVITRSILHMDEAAIIPRE